MGIALKDYSVRASKYLRPRKSKKKEMTESLQELERKLWGESFGDISKPDMKGLAGSGFDPLGIISEMERYRHNLSQHIMQNNDRPLDFLSRLASLIPRPRTNLIRFHGVFAPNSNIDTSSLQKQKILENKQHRPETPLQ